ncbi:ABC transporter substrate-binding protein [Demequina flava]|uniref:ABC transporter substrate-binding protein n=1 Tax=Demequina flava TaxID=1095025 RepID=UPI001F23F0E0|nr:ABC transporter substrate-binding protein [Demequina flava]
MAKRRTGVLLAATGMSALVLAGCSDSAESEDTAFGFPAAEQDAESPITVWVDASREGIAQAFADDNPDLTVNVETYDGNAGGSDTFRTKIASFDQSGEGWPDVVFSSQTNDTSWAGTELNGNQAYAAVLNEGLMDQEYLDGFTEGALDPMTVDGKVYGVRNDLAPVVTYYDQTLMDEFGYEVPTTWEEYLELGERLAEEHPGYILGSVGDSFVGTFVYYFGAQAPIFQVEGNTFTSDFSDDYSVRMTELIDTLVDNGTLVDESVFSAEFLEQYAGKIVAMPGPAWYTGALFENPDSLAYEAGTLGVANPLYWEGDDEVTGNVGGGVWYGSSHSTNLDAVASFLEYVTASDAALEYAGGLPAYQSVADSWLETQSESGFYGGDFAGAMTKAAGSIWSGWGYPSFSAETAYANIVVPALAAGEPVSSVTDAWQEEYLNQAQVQGYDAP